jgi:hypothetical protein
LLYIADYPLTYCEMYNILRILDALRETINVNNH